MNLARLFKAGLNGASQHRVASATPAKEIVATRLNLRDYTAYPALKRRAKFMPTLRVASDGRYASQAMGATRRKRCALSAQAMAAYQTDPLPLYGNLLVDWRTPPNYSAYLTIRSNRFFSLRLLS
jgi:hypothetical protein